MRLFIACSALLFGCAREVPPPPRCACDHPHEEGSTEPISGAPQGHAHHEVGGLPALAPLPGMSLYQLEGTFHDQNDEPFALASLRGGPVLVVMFFGSCQTACPLILAEASNVDAALGAEERARLRVVLVTFDPENDTPERLLALAHERGLPTPRWTLLSGDDDATRELAMALGVQYRRTGDGQFIHSALVTLLDADGRVATQLEGVGQPVTGLVERTQALLDAPGHE